MDFRAHIISVALAVGLLANLSCGKKATEPAPMTPPSTATGTIGVAGGQIVAHVEGGATVTLNFPPDAVRQNTDITIRSLAPSPGSWLNIALEPAGMVFYRPLTMTVRAPDGVDLTDAFLLLGDVADSLPIPTTVDAVARTLTAPLSLFGLNDDGTRVLPGLASSTATNHNNNVQVVTLSCAQLLSIATQRFDGLVAIGDYKRAVESALASASQLQDQGCSGTQAWIAQAGATACNQLNTVMQDAANSNTSTFGDFRSQTEKILYWASAVQALDPSCTHLGGFLAAIDGEISDYLLFHSSRLNSLTANDVSTFSDLKDEALTALDLSTAAYTLSLADAGDKVESQAFQPTVNQMRTVAYRMGADHHWHYPLSRMTTTGFFAARDIIGQAPPRPGAMWPPPHQISSAFDDDDIFEDLQFCATDITLEALVVSGGRLASDQAGGGLAPGQKVDAINIVTPTRGTLRLDGDLFGFNCFEGTDADNEIVFALDGTDILSVRRPVGGDHYLLPDPAEFDIMQATTAAGLTPSEGSTHELTVRRLRTDCVDDLWGPAEFTLLTATLEWENPKLDVKFNFPDLVQPGSQTQAEIRVEVEDQHGNNAYFDDIAVTLQVTGGTAAQISGTTDANGYFRTTITANQSAFKGTAAGQMGTLQVRASATAPEGVSDFEDETASVEAYILAWTFDDDLEGWNTHTSHIDWGQARWTGNGGGCVQTDGVGNNDPGPNAWVSRTIDLPADARTLKFRKSAHDKNGGTTFNRIRLVDNSSVTHVLQDWEQMSSSASNLTWINRSIDISTWAGQTVTLYFDVEDQDGCCHNQTYWDNIMITR